MSTTCLICGGVPLGSACFWGSVREGATSMDAGAHALPVCAGGMGGRLPHGPLQCAAV